MRRLLILALTGVLLAGFPAPAFGATAADFAGDWTATDIDGSTMTLEIKAKASGTLKVTLYDDGASGCDADAPPDAPDVPAQAKGRGTISGDILSGDWRVVCLGPGTLEIPDPVIPFSFTYLAGPDLLDDGTVVWNRVS